MHRPKGSTSALHSSASTVRVPHFCESSAGCEVPTRYWEHYCELHCEEQVLLAIVGLLEDGCPRCGLPAPEGSHLHFCDVGGEEANCEFEGMSPPRIRRI